MSTIAAESPKRCDERIRSCVRRHGTGSSGPSVLAPAAPAAAAVDSGRSNDTFAKSFAGWTKKLGTSFAVLNKTLRSDPSSLLDYSLDSGRLRTIAERITSQATEAQEELSTQLVSGDSPQLAKRRALKAFDLLRRAGEEWRLFARCLGDVEDVLFRTGTPGRCKTRLGGSIDETERDQLEGELGGYVRRAKQLSKSAGTLLRLANDGLGNPIKGTVTTTTKPIDQNAPVTARDWTGKWTTNYGCCFTTTQNPDGSVDGSWNYTGGGSLVDARVLEDGVTLTGRYTTRDFGSGTFTLKKTGAVPGAALSPPTPEARSVLAPGQGRACRSRRGGVRYEVAAGRRRLAAHPSGRPPVPL